MLHNYMLHQSLTRISKIELFAIHNTVEIGMQKHVTVHTIILATKYFLVAF